MKEYFSIDADVLYKNKISYETLYVKQAPLMGVYVSKYWKMGFTHCKEIYRGQEEYPPKFHLIMNHISEVVVIYN